MATMLHEPLRLVFGILGTLLSAAFFVAPREDVGR